MLNCLEMPINCIELTEEELIRVDGGYGWLDFAKDGFAMLGMGTAIVLCAPGSAAFAVLYAAYIGYGSVTAYQAGSSALHYYGY